MTYRQLMQLALVQVETFQFFAKCQDARLFIDSFPWIRRSVVECAFCLVFTRHLPKKLTDIIDHDGILDLTSLFEADEPFITKNRKNALINLVDMLNDGFRCYKSTVSSDGLFLDLSDEKIQDETEGRIQGPADDENLNDTASKNIDNLKLEAKALEIKLWLFSTVDKIIELVRCDDEYDEDDGQINLPNEEYKSHNSKNHRFQKRKYPIPPNLVLSGKIVQST